MLILGSGESGFLTYMPYQYFSKIEINSVFLISKDPIIYLNYGKMLYGMNYYNELDYK